MRHSLLLLFALSLLVLPAAAQTLSVRALPFGDTPAQTNGPTVLHITDVLMAQPATQRAMAEYHRLKAQGLLPAFKSTRTVAIGDTATFRVRSLQGRNTSMCDMEDHDFVLQAEGDRVLVWAQITELDNGNIEQDDTDALTQALVENTPSGSFNPGAGIIANDEIVFGEPPDVDGDGKTDVLVLDIQDGYDPDVGGGYVAGYVDGCDLSSAGNRADVLYLDSFPGLQVQRGVEGVAETAAHEYQHLIRFAYDLNELTFVDEGLSEWAELVNGYEGRSITYLNETSNYNVNLFRFSGNSNPSVFADYQRGGLFTTYLGERLGILETGNITRRIGTGALGYEQAINAADPSLSLPDLVADFHIANFLNNTTVDPRFGYTDSRRQDLRAVPGFRVDGRTTSATQEASARISPGAVEYLVWDQVTDFSLSINTLAPVPLRPSILLTQNGQVDIRTLSFSADPQFFEGSYERIAVIIPHTIADAPEEKTLVEYSASWVNEQTFTSETVSYDNGQSKDLILGGGAELLTRFENPSPGFGFLSKAFLPLYFFSQFGNDGAPPSTAPRDFTFTIRGVDADETPGDILFTLTATDERTYEGFTSTSLKFAEVDLADFQEEMIALPSIFFIGFVDPDAGNDDNQIVLVNSTFTQENLSYLITTAGNERALWDIGLSNGGTLNETIIPTRAEFLISSQPVANEDNAEIPERIVLAPSFPNPFSTATAIRYTLPQTTDVTLRVYDVLGREMATLVDGVQPAGAHNVSVDGSAWVSGLYFYTLEADGQRQTQRMVLIR